MKRFIVIFISFYFILCTYLCAYTLDDAIAEKEKFNYNKSLEIMETLPQDDEVIKHLAWGYLRKGIYNKALDIFLKQDENDDEVLFGIGLTYFLSKDYEKAADYLAKCLKINKDCAVCEYLIGNIKDIQGDKQEALKHHKTALKLDYNLTEARLKMARIYQDLKIYNEAFKEWSQITDIDPMSKEASAHKQSLLALITRKPEEITQPAKISEPSVLSAAPESANIPLLRIGILKNAKEFSFWSKDGFIIYDDSGMISEKNTDEALTISCAHSLFKNRRKLIIKPLPENTGIIVKEIKFAGGFAWAGTSDREYRGTMEVRLSTNGLSLINIVNLEEYIYSVLPSEMISWWPEEALKVQAVIARNQAIYRKDVSKPHRKDNFDLCNDQHCQVYNGVKQEASKARKTVDATRGEILKYNDKIVNTLFSSNCSGHTQSSNELKGWGYEPFLLGTIDGSGEFSLSLAGFEKWIKNVPDIFCAPSKHTYYAESRWIRIITQEELRERLNRNYNLGGIKRIIPLKRSKSGHINHLRIVGTKGEIEIEKENIIRSIALGRLRSTNFIVEGYGEISGLPEYFIFWGAGWGHAVGLCQSGAAGMVEKGYNYDEILKKYYKGVVIKKMVY